MINYVIIGLLVIVIILVVISITKNINEGNITERLGKLETTFTKDISDFKFELIKDLNKDFNELNDKIENKLNHINEKVNERLDENFEKTNKTFSSVLERLAKIDEAQKKIDTLSTDIVSLESILTDKKSRGTFGEVNLAFVLSSIFGENNKKIYELQKPLPNKTQVDAILYAPKPLGTICIDSKFPLENYRLMTNKSLSKLEREKAEKEFVINVKKHIDDIKSKYIIDGVTSDQAIMFLPAEAIFAEINAYHEEILEYAYKNKVWITSPTTLMSMLSIVATVLLSLERDKYSAVIQEELKKLSVDFTRYKDRWDKLSKSIDTVNKEVKEIHITSEKISNRFNSIKDVKLDKNMIKENE